MTAGAGAWARASVTAPTTSVARPMKSTGSSRLMASCHIGPASPSERVGPELELHDLARRPLAALDVERRARGVGGPQPLALPAGVRIVDAPVHPLGVEAHGVGHAKAAEPAGREGEDGP